MPAKDQRARGQELCERRDDRPGLAVPNSPFGPCGRKATLKLTEKKKRKKREASLSELRNCVEVAVTVLGSPSLIVCTVCVTVKQHCTGAV